MKCKGQRYENRAIPYIEKVVSSELNSKIEVERKEKATNRKKNERERNERHWFLVRLSEKKKIGRDSSELFFFTTFRRTMCNNVCTSVFDTILLSPF